MCALIFTVGQSATLEKTVLRVFSLWLDATVSGRGKSRKMKWEGGGGRRAGWPFRVTRALMFVLLPRRSWWMFTVSKTLKLHLQEHRGQLSVLLSPGVRPAGGRKDMQRWGEPATLVCLFSNVCILMIRVVAYTSPIKTLLHRKLHQASHYGRKRTLKSKSQYFTS